MTTRTLGVEEELMLVDPVTGVVLGTADRALAAHAERGEDAPSVVHEMYLQQLETQTPPCRRLEDLARELRRGRRAVGEAATAAGAAAVAVATPVLGSGPGEVTPGPRFRRIQESYGELSRETLLCAMHVHVQVADDDEGVRVIDGLTPWLPTLLAISANSPYFRGHDTGHASWRSEVWRRLPTHGTGERFGSSTTYHDVTDRLVAWGAGLDEQMIYFDARLSPTFPTVELRVADVCLEVEDAVLVAALSRALVTTYADRAPLPGWRSDLLGAAAWRASRDGLSGSLVDPRTFEPASPRDVIAGLVEECRDALESAGDLALVKELIDQLLTRGNGAVHQRHLCASTGDLRAVVAGLRERTERSWSA